MYMMPKGGQNGHWLVINFSKKMNFGLSFAMYPHNHILLKVYLSLRGIFRKIWQEGEKTNSRTTH